MTPNPIKIMILIFGIVVCIYLIVTNDVGNPIRGGKDCAIAEFSPDFSTVEKELCRRKRETA
jgi:hypothetical protein